MTEVGLDHVSLNLSSDSNTAILIQKFDTNFIKTKIWIFVEEKSPLIIILSTNDEKSSYNCFKGILVTQDN